MADIGRTETTDPKVARKEKQALRLARGLCPDCTRRARPGRRKCRECQDRTNKRVLEWKRRRREGTNRPMVLADRERIWALLLTGDYVQREIAAMCGVTQQTVSRVKLEGPPRSVEGSHGRAAGV